MLLSCKSLKYPRCESLFFVSSTFSNPVEMYTCIQIHVYVHVSIYTYIYILVYVNVHRNEQQCNIPYCWPEVAGTLFLTNLSNSEIRIKTYGRTAISCHHGWLVGSGLLAYCNPIGSFFYNLYVYTCLFRFMFISLFTNQVHIA